MFAPVLEITLGIEKQECTQWQTQRPHAFSKQSWQRLHSDLFLICFVELARLALKMPRAIAFAIVPVKVFLLFNPMGGIGIDRDFALTFESKQIKTDNQTQIIKQLTSLCLRSFAYLAMFTQLRWLSLVSCTAFS